MKLTWLMDVVRQPYEPKGDDTHCKSTNAPLQIDKDALNIFLTKDTEPTRSWKDRPLYQPNPWFLITGLICGDRWPCLLLTPLELEDWAQLLAPLSTRPNKFCDQLHQLTPWGPILRPSSLFADKVEGGTRRLKNYLSNFCGSNTNLLHKTKIGVSDVDKMNFSESNNNYLPFINESVMYWSVIYCKKWQKQSQMPFTHPKAPQ